MAFIRDVIIPWIKDNEEVWIAAWNAIEFLIVGVVKSIIIIIEGFIGTVTAIIRTFLAVITGDWEGAWQGIKDFFEEILELITGLFKAWGLDKVWAGIWESIQSVFDRIVGPIIRGGRKATKHGRQGQYGNQQDTQAAGRG